MPAESIKSRYKSRYGGEWITPAQFIAEIICERLARRDKIELPVKFWETAAWKKLFVQHVVAANAVLKVYSPKAVLLALKREPRAFSVRPQWFKDVVQKEQAKLNKIVIDTTVVMPAEGITLEQPRPSFVAKPSKLRNLDG